MIIQEYLSKFYKNMTNKMSLFVIIYWHASTHIKTTTKMGGWSLRTIIKQIA